MRITILHKFSLDMGYGGESWIKDFVTGFPGGNTFTIITTSFGPKNTGFKDFLVKNDIKIIDLSNRMGFFPIFIPKGIRTLFHTLKSSDIIYITGFPLLLKLFVMIMKKLYNLHTIRGFHSPVYGDRKEPAKFVRKFVYFYILEHLHLFLDRRFDVIHVLNSESQQLLENGKRNNVILIPNAIKAERYVPEEKFDKFTLLFLGRLNYQKGADLIEDIVSGLDSHNASFHFLIVGKPDLLKDRIEGLIERRSDMEYLGFVGDDIKRELLAKAHVLVSPTRYEGFPLTHLESMASGTPVVSFDVPGPSDFINDGVDSFLCSDVSGIVEKILKIKKMVEDRTYGNLCRNAIATARKYDWENIFPQFEDLFSRLTKEEVKIGKTPPMRSSFRRE